MSRCRKDTHLLSTVYLYQRYAWDYPFLETMIGVGGRLSPQWTLQLQSWSDLVDSTQHRQDTDRSADCCERLHISTFEGETSISYSQSSQAVQNIFGDVQDTAQLKIVDSVQQGGPVYPSKSCT